MRIFAAVQFHADTYLRTLGEFVVPLLATSHLAANSKDVSMKDAHRRWFELGLSTITLGVEASAVIALRTAKIFLGGDLSGKETRLMVSEKVAAFAEIQTALLSGRLGRDPVDAAHALIRSYTRKVRANRRRLT